MVMVVTWLGVGKNVCANETELVGYCGVGFAAVIFVPGLPCIGAYLIDPVCIVYGTV